MSANNKQVGGTHYEMSYIHWDFIVDTHTPYLLANISKYVSRYKVKNGIQDLEKALHYLDKAIEVNCESPDYTSHVVRFCNQLCGMEITVISNLYSADKGYQLARDALLLLIDEVKEHNQKFVRG